MNYPNTSKEWTAQRNNLGRLVSLAEYWILERGATREEFLGICDTAAGVADALGNAREAIKERKEEAPE